MSLESVIYSQNNIRKIWIVINLTDDNIETGTGTWYSATKGKTGKSIPGKFSVKTKISQHIPFENTEEVIIEVDKDKKIVTIRGLRQE
jgi:hypothetical protein